MSDFGGVLAQASTRTYYELARTQAFSQWWHWLLLVVVCAAVTAWVVYTYRRDSVELPRGLAVLLCTLRLTAFLGLLVFFLDIEKRTERQITKNSRTVVLADTSQSMALSDLDERSLEPGSRRIDQVVAEFTDGRLLNDLRASHDVIVYAFDQNSQPAEIAVLPKRPAEGAEPGADNRRQAWLASAAELRWMLFIAGAIVLAAAVCWALHFALRSRMAAGAESWLQLAAGVLAIVALVVAAVATLRQPEVSPLAALRGIPPADTAETTAVGSAQEEPVRNYVWKELLNAQGVETRLGDALRYIVAKERGGPIAGVVLITDGGQNAGTEHAVAVRAAQDANIPVFPVGMGSEKRPVNVRVVDVEAPPRVYPGDRFTIAAYLQANGFEGRTVKVSLSSRPASAQIDDASVETFEEARDLRLGPDGQVQPVRFEVEPSEQGRRNYVVRVEELPQDADQTDNVRSASVDVVDRQNKVLLIAGGPTREFQFLRNLLYRDKDTSVDVWLQTARPGVSQESDQMLFDFPRTADELFAYDAIVAFDPDWEALDELQVDLLERWVAESAGGLIVMAGPVHTPHWAGIRRGDARIDRIKALYPVAFYQYGSAALRVGRFGGEAAWPLQFTRDGLEAEFLWLEDSPAGSEATWSTFGGVYGYYAVKDAKPGAKVYARFSDPETALDGELPIYWAGQFYGAGRVFFSASGEMWRVRSLDDAYFETFYTKLIRWVSQGRLLRDSSRGVLLVEQDRCLRGDQVAVRARLTDAQHRPWVAEQVEASLVDPRGGRTKLPLRQVRESASEGMFAGQFTALEAGDYRIELTPPEADAAELLTHDVRVRVPELEIERPERNDALLKDIAERTSGEYFVGLAPAVGGAGAVVPPLRTRLAPQDQVTFLPGAPDKRFEQLLMTWLLALVCGALCLEWTLRRLSRLA